MKKLTREQELKVIQALYNDDEYIDNGGGRMVFDLPNELYNELGLTCGEYIVKVALGEKGLSQNILEIDTYEAYSHRIGLANIPYYGEVIEIMEKVDTTLCGYLYDLVDEQDCSFENYCWALCKCCGHKTGDEILDMADDLQCLIDNLIDINGYTADNAQIGINSDGDCVAYDFGFNRDIGCSEQCSDTRDYVYNDIHRHTFLNLLMEVANDEPRLFTEDHVGFMAEVEAQFFNYIDGDEEDEEDICGYDDEQDNTAIRTEILHGFTNHNQDALFFVECDKAIAEFYWNEYLITPDYIAVPNILPSQEYAINNNFVFTFSKNTLTKWQKNSILSYT